MVVFSAGVATALVLILRNWFVGEIFFYFMAGFRVLGLVSLGPSFLVGSGTLRDFLAFLLVILSFLIGGLIIRGRWGVKINRRNSFMFFLRLD